MFAFETVHRRSFLGIVGASCAGAAGLFAAPAAAKRKTTKGPVWPFYAFDNGLGNASVKTVPAKVKLLKDLGYAGVEWHLNQPAHHKELPQVLEELDKQGLELFGVYTTPFLENTLDPALAGSIKRMAGRKTRIEMAIRSKTLKPSDTRADPQAVELMKRVSDLCGDTGPVVSVYPHAWFWTERVDDGVRLARRIGRKNVGAHFNLVHWCWVKQTRPLEDVLRDALPHLFCVTINGLDGRKILPLDEGTYDLSAFMALVKKVGYRGPIGLQCYSVKGPSEVHLKRSMAKWREITKALISQK